MTDSALPGYEKSRERIFFSAMAVAMAALVFVGFGRSFFLRIWFPEAETYAAPETIFYIHGALFTTWMVLLIVQTSLVRIGRVDLHRKLGPLGAALAPVMVLIGITGSLVAARRPDGFIGVPIPPLQFLAVPLFDMVLFGLLAGLAVVWRRNAARHKRLMLLATVSLLGAATVRIPVESVAALGPLGLLLLPSLFIVLLAIWDISVLRRLHPVTLWAGLAVVASQPFRFWVMGTEPWLSFAGWAVKLLD